jgi:hypothetical protein
MNKTALEKEESRLLAHFDRCKTRKCSTFVRKKERIRKRFVKEQDVACPQKSAKAFYDCSVKLYEASTLRSAMEELAGCSRKKCAKNLRTLQTFRKRRYI